ncbi:IS5 family transposase [Streptomyces sp. Z38]|nr:IS5 family transposase [Streptomyces sp. Z38]
MSDAEWASVRDLLPVPGWLAGRGGRPEGYCHRQMIDAVRYLVDNGIKWRAMPSDFPPWPRVYAFFARWRDTGLVAELHDRLREAVRRAEGRSPEPTAAVLDSQSVKADATVAHPSREFDAGKKINGRKRHLLTDTLGLLLAVLVTPASTTDRDAARSLLPTAKDHFRQLARIWADGGYTGHLTDWTTQHLGVVLDIVRRSDDAAGFLQATLPSPLPPSACGRLRGGRPAGPSPLLPPPAEQIAERTVSSVGGFMVAGQRVQIGRGLRPSRTGRA